MRFRWCIVLLIGSLFALSALTPAYGQSGNVTTVEGPQGEQMTVTAEPHQVADRLSIRALGISDPDTTRWALSIIGASLDDEISLSYGDETLPITRIERPDDGVGPTRVFVSQESFLTMAGTDSVTLTVGPVTTSLPDQLRSEMKKIFERSS